MTSYDQFSFNNTIISINHEEFSFGEWKSNWLTEEDERLSPRELEIARCQKLMKELVNNVPDCVCELSLKDLVELPNIIKEAEKKKLNLKGESRLKKGSGKHSRSQSMEIGGSLLKLFFPIPPKNSKRSNSNKSSKSTSRSNSSGSLKFGTSSRSNSSGSSKHINRSSSNVNLNSDNDSKTLQKVRVKKERKEIEAKIMEKKPVGKKEGHKPVLIRNCSRNSMMMKTSASVLLRNICSFKR